MVEFATQSSIYWYINAHVIDMRPRIPTIAIKYNYGEIKKVTHESLALVFLAIPF